MLPSRVRRLAVTAGLALSAAGVLATTVAPAPAVPLAGGSSSAAVGSRGGFTPRVAATTGSYAFSSMLDGRPVRWDPCAPIRWTASTRSGPAGGLDVLKAAVARVASVSGTTWQYVGPTSTVPSTGVLPRTASASYPPVVIGWTDGAHSDLLRGQARSVLGMTRTAWFGVQTPDGRKHAATRAAVIALDSTDRLPLRGASSWQAVALHELGHALGLAHVGDGRQLMATVLPRTLTDLQSGDRAGLVRLGRAAGCVDVPGVRR